MVIYLKFSYSGAYYKDAIFIELETINNSIFIKTKIKNSKKLFLATNVIIEQLTCVKKANTAAAESTSLFFGYEEQERAFTTLLKYKEKLEEYNLKIFGDTKIKKAQALTKNALQLVKHNKRNVQKNKTDKPKQILTKVESVLFLKNSSNPTKIFLQNLLNRIEQPLNNKNNIIT
jgi:hypothetical protein